MPEIYTAFSPSYLRGSHMAEPEYVRTIESVVFVEMKRAPGVVEMEILVTFDRGVGDRDARMLVLNKMNAAMIAKVLGSEETDDWIGKPITIVRGEWLGRPAVRIKPFVDAGAPTETEPTNTKAN